MSTQTPQRPESPGLRMGRPFGIPVYVSPTWLIVAAFITYTFQPQVADGLPGKGAVVTYLVAFVFAVFLYLSVLLHELAHCVVARYFGLPVRRITLYLLGGVSEIEREPETPTREFLVAFAGPLLSLGLAGIGFVLSEFIPQGTIPHVLVFQLWVSNLIVGVFNLLPGLPLDGGRMLRAGVWKITRNSGTGTIAAAWFGRALAVALVAVPLLSSLVTGQEPPGLWLMLWSVLLASFIWIGASQALRVARVRARLPRVQARALARRAIAVTAEVPLAEAMRRATQAEAGAMVVVDHEGHPIAIVNESAVTATPEQRRPWVTVGSLARSLEPSLVLPADLSGESLLDAMRDAPSGEYLLVERGGDVYGVLVTADVNRVFAGV
ncbi:peptidase M50 [Sphaerisporangium krabiense]|uniref:Zinc metalloprotease n=1 Tax=Sphaerisporangium krabiense TaxID=763782 RepID=A0A7W8ZBU4_9ACTN|nr:site-2 protease family protein [Sphaerisporangium krabiense]MBB5631139.1 Zn-dependent protease [Sphaerisporangium krabiense]GII61250.1 peptidase M50 [Sphaerisporangium krabiense]